MSSFNYDRHWRPWQGCASSCSIAGSSNTNCGRASFWASGISSVSISIGSITTGSADTGSAIGMNAGSSIGSSGISSRKTDGSSTGRGSMDASGVDNTSI